MLKMSFTVSFWWENFLDAVLIRVWGEGAPNRVNTVFGVAGLYKSGPDGDGG